MKLFIFGIDGLGKESLEVLGLKRLATRIKKGVVGNPAIHSTISRGWPEIYTGKSAYETGAFYQSPEYVNGRIIASQKTGLSLIQRTISEEDFLWNQLNKQGLRVGLFTVPTINEPVKTNGFCVAGTGSGYFGNQLTEDDVYPSDLLYGLRIKDIDLGFRMGFGAYMPRSIDDLELNANKHLADYFYTLERVLAKCPVDVCFAASRFINEMAYKFIAVCTKAPLNSFEKQLKEIVLALCSSFDAQLDSLLEEINPEHLFIVSDHGITQFNFELNLNQLLVELGLMERRGSFSHWKELVRPMYYWGKRHLFMQRVGYNTPKYELAKADIYSIGFTNALYLKNANNKNVHLKDHDRVNDYVIRLNRGIEKLDLQENLRFEVSPLALCKRNLGFPVPSIICHMANGIANTERQFSPLKVRDYQFNRMFDIGFYGEHSGCKSEDTLAAYVGNATSESVDFSKLTKVYDSILTIARL